MRALPRHFLPLFFATAVLAACERAPTPEAPTPVPVAPVAPPAAPVVQPPVEAPPPPPPPPVQTSGPPTAHGGRLPLVRILAIAQRRVPGEVIKVDLDDDDDDPPTYELEILTPEGRVMEIKLDARTGAILDIEED